MQMRTNGIVRLLLVSAMAGVLAGCAATQRQALTQADADSPSARPTSPSASAEDAADLGNGESDAIEKKAEEAAKKARQRDKLERDFAIANRRVTQARLSQAHAASQHAAAMASSETELMVERDRLRIFAERKAPMRVEQGRLDLERADDRKNEAIEELHQLELMYAEDDFADQTKEIVLERGRRRLERSKRDLQLRQERFVTLTTKTIPLETLEHEFSVRKRERSFEKAAREAEASELTKAIGVMSAEAEVERLQAEIAAAREKKE